MTSTVLLMFLWHKEGFLHNIVLSMEQLDANDLLIFARIVEAGNLSRAAERLGLPKSRLSRRLAQLERQLGERLLLRTTRRLALTEFGQLLLEHARQLAAEVDAATALSEHRQARPSGRLRVSMPNDLAVRLLSDALAAFSALHPGIRLEIDLSPRRVDLLAEKFDLALRVGDPGQDGSLVARRMGVFTHGLYASPGYLATHGEPREPGELMGHRAVLLLSRQGDALPWRLSREAQHWEGLPPGRLLANAPELLAAFAVADAGIAALPDLTAAEAVRQGRLRRILPDWALPSHVAWAVFPERRLMPAKTRAFLDLLEQVLAPVLQEAPPTIR